MESASANLSRELLEHRQEILAYVFALTRNFDVAEEVFQQVALSIIAEKNVNPQGEDFMRWTRTLVRNQIARNFRNKARFVEFGQEYAERLARIVDCAYEESPDFHEAHRLRKEALNRCIDKLSEKSRQLLKHRYQEELPLSDVATRLGWTYGAAKVALSRCRKALFECMARSASYGGQVR